ncbi:MAG: aminoacyl-histidine dipeptidase [Lachnospiraceae bacterium]|nr:aminoacyl-histidine dipeptidase [Lachnospiraceae bacterium]
MAVLEGLKPAAVFKYFEEICSIPHGSRNTKQISDYLKSFAEARSLKVIQDESNNIIIKKPGTAGYEDHPTVIIQGHMDMVCEKEEDCGIDFEKDGLTLEVKDGKVSAKGTTLGGDDGIAVAYALAILDADDIPHPPLEVVITVDEEIGMLGAAALDGSVLEGRVLLNVDSEDEGHILCSCAGGATIVAALPVEIESDSGYEVWFSVDKLTGGHSGIEIIKGTANANVVIGRILYELNETVSMRLISLSGGLKDNAIPRAAEARLLLDTEGDVKEFAERIAQIKEVIGHELQKTDPEFDLHIAMGVEKKKKKAMTYESTRLAIAGLHLLPAGIQKMSKDFPGLVQTSLNLGVLESDIREVRYSFCVRSSVSSEKEELIGRIRCLMDVLGGTVKVESDYPSWEYRDESKLRDIMAATYRELYGSEPVLEAVHAGVECGIFAGKLEGLDAVSFGPDLKDIHTTRETLDIASAQRTWEYLLEVLKRL